MKSIALWLRCMRITIVPAAAIRVHTVGDDQAECDLDLRTWPGGALTGATADGRKGGREYGRCINLSKSWKGFKRTAGRFPERDGDHRRTYQGTLFNLKFHPTMLKTEEDCKKLSQLIRVYLTNGGKRIEFDVKRYEGGNADAQIHPEEHEELTVRVAGYGAYFNRLPESIQNEVIERTSQNLKDTGQSGLE